MDDNNLAARICRLPAAFYAGDKSMLTLVVEALSNVSALPPLSELIAFLTGHHFLIEQWLRWSSNKRTDNGWYFSQQDDGYTVGWIPKGEVLHFGDPVEACSEFILREIASLADMARTRV
jgi:hypothetical protein